MNQQERRHLTVRHQDDQVCPRDDQHRAKATKHEHASDATTTLAAHVVHGYNQANELPEHGHQLLVPESPVCRQETARSCALCALLSCTTDE